MKKTVKKTVKTWRLGSILMMALLFLLNFCLAACGGKEKAPSFGFSKTPPTEVKLLSEIVFGDYIEEDDDAVYSLYASYYDPVNNVQVNDKKQGSLVFVFALATDYTFEIVRTIGTKETSITCTISVLPPEPALSDPSAVEVAVGTTLEFTGLLNLSEMMVTPSELEDEVKFTSVVIEDALFTDHDHSAPESLAGKTSYTFAEEAIYRFTVEVENKSGSANKIITVNTYDKNRYSEKTTLNFVAEERELRWTEITGASAYRVWVNGEKKANDVTEAKISVQGYEEGDYTFKVAPVYAGGAVYLGSVVEGTYYVGYERKPLSVSVGQKALTWQKRPFATGYVVKEGTQTYQYGNDVFSHVWQIAYEYGYRMSFDIYATFDEGTLTETVVKNNEFGTVTLNRMDIYSTANMVKNFDGIEYVEFDGFGGNTYMMVEFTGKNAPNFAFRAAQAYSSVDITQTQTWLAGAMACNSWVGDPRPRNGGLYVTMGIQANGGIALSGVIATDDPEVGPGLNKFADDKHYLMIVGYERNGDGGTIYCKTFVVEEDGSLLLGFDGSGSFNYIGVGPSGSKAVIYGNCATGGTDDPESVTFKYFNPSETLAGVVNGLPDGYAYKAKLKTALGV